MNFASMLTALRLKVIIMTTMMTILLLNLHMMSINHSPKKSAMNSKPILNRVLVLLCTTMTLTETT